RARARARGAHVRPPRAAPARARGRRGPGVRGRAVTELAVPAARRIDPRLAALRRIAIVPAFNEEECVPRVIDEIRAVDPDCEIVVVDDGSVDRTADAAAAKGARVLRLPFNLGIGGAVQTGFRFAAEAGFARA